MKPESPMTWSDRALLGIAFVVLAFFSPLIIGIHLLTRAGIFPRVE